MNIKLTNYVCYASQKVSAKSGKSYYVIEIVDTRTNESIKQILLTTLEYQAIISSEKDK